MPTLCRCSPMNRATRPLERPIAVLEPRGDVGLAQDVAEVDDDDQHVGLALGGLAELLEQARLAV